MKILIADDEVVERTALEKILNKYYKNEIDIIKSAVNGEQALEITKSFDPDIIFMDIKMPRMDGIVASLKIREFNKKAKIIIVTAFSDFTFAKQAITCKVSDYLVKPYSIKTLKNTMDKVIDELTLIEHNKLEKLQLQQSLAIEFLNKMLERKNLNSIELEKYLNVLNINDNSYCFVVTKNKKKVSAFEDKLLSLSFFDYTFYLLIGPDIKSFEKLTSNNLILTKSKIESDCLIIESVFVSTLNNLSLLIEKKSLENFDQRLYEEIVNCKYNDINIIGQNIAKSYLLKYGFGNLFFKNMFDLVIKEIQLLYKVNQEDAKLYAEKYENEERQLEQNNFEYYKNEFPGILINLCDLYHGNRKSSQEILVENTIKYLKDNFKSNIGMDNISEAMFVSKSYLSRVFTKYKNSTVMDYLLTIRINEAKKMLIDGNTISNTSSEVGFSNPAYFSKSFKKETGISPSQFLENNNNS